MSSIPYQPMWKRKEVSFERMQEILSKHKPSIRWKRVATDAMESNDGYRINREHASEGHRYMAFYGKTSLGNARFVGCYASSELAKLGCGAHRQAMAGSGGTLPGAKEAAQMEPENTGEDSGSG